jgi:hypothetical protein
MQSTLRTKLAAAAMLLLPVGALVATQPAAAQERGWDSEHRHGQRYARDHRAPDIFAVSPHHSDRVSDRGLTRITARFSDNRSGVDPRSVVLRIDGRDVTDHARIDRDDIRYAANLQPGRHTAELRVRDRAGNLGRYAWAFEVVDRGRHYGHGYGRYEQAQRW